MKHLYKPAPFSLSLFLILCYIFAHVTVMEARAKHARISNNEVNKYKYKLQVTPTSPIHKLQIALNVQFVFYFLGLT